jgi:hypothetical protein
MPVLEITPEMVGPNRSWLGVQYVQSIMFYPHDAARREEWMRGATANAIRSAINAVPAARRAADAAHFVNWFDVARAAQPQHILDKQAEYPIIHGVQAGELFLAACQEYAGHGRVKLEALKDEMVKRGQRSEPFRGHKALNISQKTIENVVWARYKLVSHLWAASLYLCMNGSPFPCILEQFPWFLSLARLFAEAGSIIPLRGSKERDGRRRTLLDPERIWTIPTDLPLLDLPYTLEEYLRIKSSVRSPSAPPISTPKSLF